MHSTDTAIVWLRRDLRLADQPALHAAAQRHARVLPLYLHAPEEESPWLPGAASRWWLHHSLSALAESLAALGSPLLIRRGPSTEALRQLARETGAGAVYWTRLYEPTGIARDRMVKEALRADGLLAESFNAALLFEPWELKTGGGEPYRVFSPFWRNAEARLDHLPAPLPAPARLSPPERSVAGLSIAELNLLPRIPWDEGFYPHWTPGEAGARQRLEQFAASAIGRYKEQRDQPAVPATSGLSPHLHFGELSPRSALLAAREAARTASPGWLASAEHFVRELGWREFSHHLLFHYPATDRLPMYDKFAAFPWRQPDDYASDLAAWQQGRTGIPIVDAGMRQLWQSGWVHNRVRMIVASLLTKNLLIPWQEGAQWFWDTLVDASLPQNSLGWQWSAGCGADAAPYFRIFNPVLQGEKFDPEGSYTRRWLPELARLPAKYLHRPWEAPSEIRRAAGLGLDSVYARPIVDLARSRDRALAAYEQIKAG
ncbi:deoxyribodipyrimidine photo-lyase [Stagnimonas aquatica]|uniref:Deoxyribodipyrimidine photo-lyase n=1 Tax=Stagnimonas aquatica TaxID=2689987 RepID=A0A3N0VL49_9GAMM|nr:deoxyribodipyrimidine photo-lyase [Stagnimonas aquatica]ROH93440.1 deoxyribodipyrimidine photo-lyase [Stagnimonas aquatica]